MALWSSSNVANPQQEPKSLWHSTAAYKSDIYKRYDNVYADKHGWKMVYPSNSGTTKTEVLVAIKNLSDKLGAPTVNFVHFKNNAYPRTDGSGVTANTNVVLGSNVAWSVNVAYNQQVQIIGTNVPSINITQTGSISSNITGTYASGNGKNILTFIFTTPVDFQGNTTANTTLSITGAQPIVVTAGSAGNTINGVANSTMTANVWIPTAANSPLPLNVLTAGQTLSVTTPVTTVTGVFFGNSGTSAHNTNVNMYVTFSNPVNVMGAGRPNVTLNLKTAGNTANAIYLAGNTTANLQFLANVHWVDNATVANAATIYVGILNDTVANVAVNTYISVAVANAAGTFAVT